MLAAVRAKRTVTKQLFTVQETAVRTCRSESSVWRDLAEGRLKCVRIGGSTRVTGDSIDAMVAGEAPIPTPRRNPNPNVKPTDRPAKCERRSSVDAT
jgi:hypothetical protein